MNPRRPVVGLRLVLGLVLGLGVVLAALGAGCGGERGGPATWYQDVAPLLAERCNGCHQAGGIGPFPLDDYETARANAARMLQQIESGAMPPFNAREEEACTPRFGWVDDPRVTDDELATLRSWVEQGFLRGERAKVPPPRSQDLPGVTTSLVPSEGFATAGDKDQFICFVLDPEITEPMMWLTGLQVRPELPEVVHHAILTALPAGALQDELVATYGIGRPYNCGIGTPPGDFNIHTWTPGNQPLQLPEGAATPLARGVKIVMQLHYHPGQRSYPPERTTLDLRLTSKWPRKVFYTYSVGNALAAPLLLPGPGDAGEPELRIPAGAADHLEVMRLPIGPFATPDVRVVSVTPHAHLVATHVSATLERPAPRGKAPQRECLATGPWNFDWQRIYAYDASFDELPTLADGDVLELRCRWNNTLANPFVHRMLKDSGLPPRPIDLTYGEDTVNEMCLEIFGVLVDAPPAAAAGALPLPPLLRRP